MLHDHFITSYTPVDVQRKPTRPPPPKMTTQKGKSTLTGKKTSRRKQVAGRGVDKSSSVEGICYL